MREILLATSNPGKAREMAEILNVGDRASGPAAQAGPGEPVRWRHLSEFADKNWPEPVEDGDTFMANAELKARHYARLSGLWTIADDSGLVVDALGGEPGVRSARYAGEPKSDRANNELLIRNLAGVSAEKRTARFCCALVLAGNRGTQTTGQESGSPADPAGVKKAGETPAPQPGEQSTPCAGEMPAPQADETPEGAGIAVLARAEGTVEGRIIDDARGANGFGYDPHFHVDAFGMTTAEMAPDQKHAISHRGQALRRLREKLAHLI